MHIHTRARTHTHTHIVYIHLSVSGYLGFFYLLAIVNNTAMEMDIQISHQDPASNSFGYIPTIGINESYNSVFNFWESAILFSKVTKPFYNPILVHSFSTYSLTVAIFCFVDSSHPSGYEGENVVLICISLMISKVEHLFICLLAISVSSSRNVYSSSLSIFQLSHLVFFVTIVPYLFWVLTHLIFDLQTFFTFM